MANYRVRGPDGATHVFEGPDDATPEQVVAAAERQFGSNPAPAKSAPLLDRIGTGLGDVGRGLVRGARDVADAGSQMLVRSFEGGAQDYANSNPQMPQDRLAKAAAMIKSGGQQGAVYPTLADKMGGARPLADAATAERQRVEAGNAGAEQDFRQNWMGGRDTTAADIGRVGGNILASAPLTYALPGAGAATIPGKIGAGALQGAVGGVMQPVNVPEGGDFWKEKGDQAKFGAATGGATAGVLGLASKAFSGSSNPALREMVDEGIRPTPGQALGGWANTTEQKLTSAPLLGDVIRSSRNNAIEQFDRATVNKVLKPIGEKLDNATPMGRDAIDEAARKVGQAYDDLLPKLTLKADNQFLNEIDNLRTLAKNLPPEMSATFENTLKNQVLDKIKGSGQMTGETMKAVESELGRIRTLYGRSPMGGERELGNAIGELQSILRDVTERSNPMFKGQLSANNTAYALLKRVEGAVAYTQGEAGKFTPNQLVSAVKAADKTRGKSSFARGNAMMQDWAENAKGTLGNTVPDSGTAGRIAMNILTGSAFGGGAAAVSPWMGAAGLLALPYAPFLRNLPGYLAKSPNAAGRVAATATNALTPAAAYGAPAAVGLLGGQ